MRKLLFIVLAFTACLLFPEGGDGACIRQEAPSAVFSAGDMHTDEYFLFYLLYLRVTYCF